MKARPRAKKKAEPVKQNSPTPDEVLELHDVASQVWTIKIAVDAGEDSEHVWAALNQVERSLRRLGARVEEMLAARKAVA